MTLVVLPGMGCSPRLWSTALPDAPVVHGTLDRPSIDGCVDALLDVLPPRFALAGLSLGGIVAMALVRTAPERVTRLALLATNARGPTSAQYEGWAAARAAFATDGTARDVQRDLLPVLLHDHAHDETALAMAEDLGAADFDRQLEAQATRIDERPALARVAVPTLVLAGGADRLCPVDRHEEIAALVPGARLEVLEDVGHLVTLEAPERVRAHLTAWLGSG
ncbi:alpha/beta fold hydrolase [Pseudonocardia sp. MH-G8]|uniref:alpha/beta fold hydrolase n=1 Tax=Pseudonocardia sp. MH-G8 TaxID=1854588 RepID=UPI000B9FDF2D|nr:alpha/beta fold hydrolase [Pseudonocardia sp. MH-G8]OZM80169.1 hypothetical protein CFP66_21655 [Pseudonocardia sp. MH-G8]